MAFCVVRSMMVDAFLMIGGSFGYIKSIASRIFLGRSLIVYDSGFPLSFRLVEMSGWLIVLSRFMV